MLGEQPPFLDPDFDPGEPPPLPEDDPGYDEMVPPRAATADTRITDATLARWIGLQAAKYNVLRPARALIHPGALAAFQAGAELPASTRLPHGLTEAERSHWLRELRRVGGKTDEPAATDLPVTIVRLVQRHDVGTGTRYDVTLRANGKEYLLRDLIAADLLSFERLRPIACDARLVLDPLPKGGAKLWTAEVRRAMDEVQVRDMAPEESDAMDIRHRLLAMATAARKWEYAPDDTRPIGLSVIERGGLIGWPREPMQHELRSRMGKVGRVALRRATESLGWVAREWKYPGHGIYVWCCDMESWAKTLSESQR